MGKPYKWTQDRIDFIKENIEGTPYLEMVEIVNSKFGEPYISRSNLKALLAKNGWRNGRDTKCKPGQPSWNKGRRISEEVRSKLEPTMFKPGSKPWNWRPVGSTRVNVEGYIEIKTAEPNKWEHMHKVVWREQYGMIPAGKCLIFKDGNRENCSIENLMLVSKTAHSIMNKKKLRSNTAELTETGALLAELMGAQNKRKRGINA